jgi:nitrite reductase/ring-hydroxylating ferredoxin subunit
MRLIQSPNDFPDIADSSITVKDGLLPPYPQGWYAVGFASELSPGRVLTRRFMGRDIVVFRTGSGRVFATEAHCPHLGAHLGHGGTVVGEALRCPFHNFTFDAHHGTCIETPYGPPPPAARLRRLDLRQIHGVLLVFHDPNGDPPTWEVADYPQPADEWMPLSHTMLKHRGHPQETTENSVDIGHFGTIHGFEDVRITEPLTVDGAQLRIRYVMRAPTFPRRPGKGLDTDFLVVADGLGFSRIEVTLPRLGWTVRQLVLATPVDPQQVEMRLAISARRHVGRAAPLWKPIDATFQRVLLKQIASTVRLDIAIWTHKKFLDRPALAAGDGPIGPFRKWTRQFYATGVSPSPNGRS